MAIAQSIVAFILGVLVGALAVVRYWVWRTNKPEVALVMLRALYAKAHPHFLQVAEFDTTPVCPCCGFSEQRAKGAKLENAIRESSNVEPRTEPPWNMVERAPSVLVGRRVLTSLDPAHATLGFVFDPEQGALYARRDGVEGVVTEYVIVTSGSFRGLKVAFVKHDDGVVGCYAGTEFQVIDRVHIRETTDV